MARTLDECRAAAARIELLEPEMLDVLRAKTESERLAIGLGMWRSAQAFLTQVIRQEHPDWGEEPVAREVAFRMSHGLVGRDGKVNLERGTGERG